MESVVINGKTYGYVSNYRDNEMLRNDFNSLTKKVYGFDFCDWYEKGYWSERYVPHSLMDGNKMISNISVNIIDFDVMGELKTYIQLGTVMTDDEYRNLGLSRYLMERVLEEWRNRCDMIYLFANDSVLNFYPKFGFKPVNEYQCLKEVNLYIPETKLEKLDMADDKDREFLVNKINKASHISKVSMRDNSYLVMFYCISFMDHNVYYIRELDAVVIAEFEDDKLIINDIFCEKEITLDNVITAMGNNSVKKVILGFTPRNTAGFNEIILDEEDSTLFILDDKWNIFARERFRFQVLSHA